MINKTETLKINDSDYFQTIKRRWFFMKLGDNLKELLEKHDMTQKQLALELDITPAALGNYIRNIREPDYTTLIRIADYFQVSTDFLFNHKHNSPITHDEETLLRIFRSLSVEQKEIYIELGKAFIKQNNKKLSTDNQRDK